MTWYRVAMGTVFLSMPVAFLVGKFIRAGR
jgi:hypothetical protein